MIYNNAFAKHVGFINLSGNFHRSGLDLSVISHRLLL